MRHSALDQFLPSNFLFVIPLYIGVELILSFAILNKAGGVYGVLSILTGHHMNFWQWVYNLLAFLVLPFYVSALFSFLDRSTNLRKMCLGCLIYILDTLVGFVYTLYFVYFWFSREDNHPAGTLGESALDLAQRSIDTSQSASPGRELFLTISGTFLTTSMRVYFCIVFLSFTKQLLLQSIRNQWYHGHDSVCEDAMHTSVGGKIRKVVYALEMRARHFFIEMFVSGNSPE
ncbi:DUF1753-domain-containing protein [Metschnikowia bicuspidata var. bicuspidata NRRL YB-4993]|uniref:DUF1753-domain-containing protein n=1 Tax=Metschnikowia bicuspidata var. bicuspidata NRRL YB-4993 TaxID=869754 RepID=A0A1A0H6K9_9ASCO|nr:DUF1753-domain-containing protein [Metschnikowia bicuspidata var. bicuspidata NRRL YB-4993]OBA19595.1 DUF1753-domain-containing protein [Metschnikowia bicuspidata var. bicuspidata NRRL YB-4993]